MTEKTDNQGKNDEQTLSNAIAMLERRHKSLLEKLESSSPSIMAELKARNQELKDELSKLEGELLSIVSCRKNALDATGISDRLQVLKIETLAYCADRKLDPQLWKKLESL